MKLRKIFHVSECITTPTSPRASRAGYTLIEVMVVIVLVSLIAGMGLMISQSSIGRSYASSERDLFVSELTQVRAKALANIDEKAQGLYVNATCYKFFEGNVPNTAPTCASTDIQKSAPFTGIYRFAQLTGNAIDGTGVTTITMSGSSYTVDINAAGRINW